MRSTGLAGWCTLRGPNPKAFEIERVHPRREGRQCERATGANTMTTIVRFAPSPTGQVHIGNIRVAIYNWLYARHTNGRFLLRVEDTDRERSTPEAVQAVTDAMAWMGLEADGDPMYQSARRDAHLAAAEDLLARDLAYRERRGENDQGECIVFRMPADDRRFDDAVKGPLQKRGEDMQDLVIVRSNGTPVFHLANVVDDIEMGITHIIRGDDHVENTFRHLALFAALGAGPPIYAHLPMIVNGQGKPYSKRDGAAFVGEFRDQGFLPEALFNYLVLLGWSPGDDREVLSRDEMITLFDFDRIQSSPAQMDVRKCEWMNGEYIRALDPDMFRQHFENALLTADDLDPGKDPAYTATVSSLMQERTRLYSHVPDAARYFFTEDYPYDQKAVRKRLLKDGVRESLTEIRTALAALPDFDAATTEACIREAAAARDIAPGQLIHPIRVAVSGSMQGPGLFEMLKVIGRDRVLARIDHTLETYADGNPDA